MVAAVTDRMIDAHGGRRHRRRTCGPRLRRYEGILDHAILYAPSFRVAPARVRESALGLIDACAAPAPAPAAAEG